MFSNWKTIKYWVIVGHIGVSPPLWPFIPSWAIELYSPQGILGSFYLLEWEGAVQPPEPYRGPYRKRSIRPMVIYGPKALGPRITRPSTLNVCRFKKLGAKMRRNCLFSSGKVSTCQSFVQPQPHSNHMPHSLLLLFSCGCGIAHVMRMCHMTCVTFFCTYNVKCRMRLVRVQGCCRHECKVSYEAGKQLSSEVQLE